MLKKTIISLLALLPLKAIAQQSGEAPSIQVQLADKPQQPLHLTKPARRTVAFQATLSAVKEYCGKNAANAACKSDSTEYDAASKLVEKSTELQAYIESGIPPENPIKFVSLPAPDRSSIDASGKSWMEPGLRYQDHEDQPAPADPRKSLQNLLSDAELAVSRLAEMSARELGDSIVHDNQFPQRSQWEQRLYEKKEKVVAAARAWIAVASRTNDTSLSHSAKTDFDIQMVGYKDIVNEGISKAADWERNR
jgi:hypothetical protein